MIFFLKISGIWMRWDSELALEGVNGLLCLQMTCMKADSLILLVFMVIESSVLLLRAFQLLVIVYHHWLL
jgi:hypothetical protein